MLGRHVVHESEALTLREIYEEKVKVWKADRYKEFEAEEASRKAMETARRNWLSVYFQYVRQQCYYPEIEDQEIGNDYTRGGLIGK